jgi:hypothetical protein
MKKERWGRVCTITVVGIMMTAVLKACTPVTVAPRPVVEGVVGVSEFPRDALEGGRVTVFGGVVPGPLPDTNMAGPPTTVAWFSNLGEEGKHERRYGLKPNSQAQYEIVLSSDGSGRTKWTMNEINPATKVRTSFRSGRVWACEDYHRPAAAREVGFRDCPRRVPYDSTERRSISIGNQLTSFANYIKGGETGSETRLSAEDGPIWISCTSGCCTLGAYN